MILSLEAVKMLYSSTLKKVPGTRLDLVGTKGSGSKMFPLNFQNDFKKQKLRKTWNFYSKLVLE